MLSRVRAVRIYRDCEGQEFIDEAIREQSLRLHVNGTLYHEFACLPEHLHELVLGYLITSGRIDKTDQLAAAYFASENTVCLASVSKDREKDMARLPEHPFDIQWVWNIIDTFEQGVIQLHQDTGALHSAMIASQGEVICQAYDIGRHNAIDKAIGMALKLGTNLTKCELFTSGRVPSDVVKKATQAGIPVLIGRKAPTDKAIRLAAACNLSLVCYAKWDRCNLYKEGVADI